jgi:hypothetical protein
VEAGVNRIRRKGTKPSAAVGRRGHCRSLQCKGF